MNYSELCENTQRGTFDFPIELYRIGSMTAPFEMALHWHLEYELIFVREGRFTLSLDGREQVLDTGESAWVGDGVVHGGTAADGCRLDCVVFDLGTLLHDTPVCARSATEFLAGHDGFTTVFPRESDEAALARRLCDGMAEEAHGYEWTTVGLMWQMMGMLLGRQPAGTLPRDRGRINRLKNVLTLIRSRYAEPLTLDELAEVAGMSPRYFCRAFAALTGKTPIAYVNYYRVESAAEQLRRSTRSVTEIALACGFNDMSYFSKTFARQKGQSPTAYRRENRENT